MVGGRVGNDYTLIEQRQMNLSKAILMVNVNERQGLHGLCRLYVLSDGEGLARWGRWSSSVRRTPELRAGASTGTVDEIAKTQTKITKTATKITKTETTAKISVTMFKLFKRVDNITKINKTMALNWTSDL